MRVFLDTNVLVSAFAARGICAELLEVVLLEHELIVGAHVLREFDKALRQKVKLPASRVEEIVRFIAGEALVTVKSSRPFEGSVDPDDALVIGDALEGQSEVLVTGDAALLRLRAADQLAIVSPRQFWERLQSGPQRPR
ncbi:MAG TPA: putative toxin-antitoxin system toxin component, PIN family [Burkholderiaceae bacterium]|nr:putative toxin-antitoxin system toxin component, PIN family [Burkholderiaceae bacterium]HQR70864.1 putative toxin-antitoxin system toxin component, PIN family [Burkholderiaceae bacterium]